MDKELTNNLRTIRDLAAYTQSIAYGNDIGLFNTISNNLQQMVLMLNDEIEFLDNYNYNYKKNYNNNDNNWKKKYYVNIGERIAVNIIKINVNINI